MAKSNYELQIREFVRLELYRLDWIRILKNAIVSRRTSWSKDPVIEWRNASDEILGALMNAAESARIFLTLEQRVRKNVVLHMPKNEEDILFFAFRYALGRMTGAVDLLVTEIKNRWHELRPATQRQIQDEIRRYPEQWGELRYKQYWQEILDLKCDEGL